MSTSKPRKRMSAAERRTVIEQAATEVFAAHGYQRASMDEIADRSGVSVPVVYDHFSSKRELHRRLLERHYEELRALWRAQLGPEPPAQEDAAAPGATGSAHSADPADLSAEDVARAFDAWFGYIEDHPYAWRMLFRDTTGDPEVRAEHATVIAGSRDALLPFFSRLIGIPYAPDQRSEDGAPVGDRAGERDRVAAELAWEVCRGVLQGLALWWLERPEVPRGQLVDAAMDAVWTGFERSRRGEGRAWRASPRPRERA